MSDQTSMNVQQQDLNTAVTYMKENDAFVRLSENGIRLDTLDFIPVMNRMGIQGELHTLAKRNHCFQVKAAPGTGSYTWMDRIWEFMTKKGFNK